MKGVVGFLWVSDQRNVDFAMGLVRIYSGNPNLEFVSAEGNR